MLSQSLCPNKFLPLVNLAVSCQTVVADSIVFAVTVYQVWGTWVLQRDLKQDSSNSIVSILLKQGISPQIGGLYILLTRYIKGYGDIGMVLVIYFMCLNNLQLHYSFVLSVTLTNAIISSGVSEPRVL